MLLHLMGVQKGIFAAKPGQQINDLSCMLHCEKGFKRKQSGVIREKRLMLYDPDFKTAGAPGAVLFEQQSVTKSVDYLREKK